MMYGPFFALTVNDALHCWNLSLGNRSGRRGISIVSALSISLFNLPRRFTCALQSSRKPQDWVVFISEALGQLFLDEALKGKGD